MVLTLEVKDDPMRPTHPPPPGLERLWLPLEPPPMEPPAMEDEERGSSVVIVIDDDEEASPGGRVIVLDL